MYTLTVIEYPGHAYILSNPEFNIKACPKINTSSFLTSNRRILFIDNYEHDSIDSILRSLFSEKVRITYQKHDVMEDYYRALQSAMLKFENELLTNYGISILNRLHRACLERDHSYICRLVTLIISSPFTSSDARSYFQKFT